MKSKNDQPEFWQDVENKVLDPDVLKSEFGEGEMDYNFLETKKSRRSFLKIMGFTLSTAPLASCIRIPVKKALPYMLKHEDVVPGVANWYATSLNPLSGSSLLVKTREGRPIKIEGNSSSEMHMGGTTANDQASLLSLYDSSRYKGPKANGQNVEWNKVDQSLINVLEEANDNGKTVQLFTSSVCSPSELRLIQEFKNKYNNVEHIIYDTNSYNSLVHAHEDVFGVASLPRLNFKKADYVLSFEADFLGTWLSPVEFTKQYTYKKDILEHEDILKHVQFESRMTLTGGNADIRFTSSEEEQNALIINILAYIQKKTKNFIIPGGDKLPKADYALVQKISKDLLKNSGKSLVVSGSTNTNIQAMIAGINHLLGNYGKTISIYDNPFFKGATRGGFEAAISKMKAGKVGVAMFWDVNPLHSYSDSKGLKAALKSVGKKVSFATWPDETSKMCDFILPSNYYLESWNDYFVAPGHLSFSQPVIQSIFGSRMAAEFFLTAVGKKDYHKYVQATAKSEFYNKQSSHMTFTSFWDSGIQAGVHNLKGFLKAGRFTNSRMPILYSKAKRSVNSKGLSLVCYESISMRDGKLINNPWLQELPDPITKVTWDNYVLVSPKLAKERSLKSGSVVKVAKGNSEVELPIVVQPGMAHKTIAIAVGYGRSVSGKVGQKLGRNVASFMEVVDGCTQASVDDVTMKSLGKTQELAQTQTHHSMEGRNLVRETSVKEYLKNPKSGNEEHAHIISLWSGHDKEGPQWAMAIDLNKCTGCSGCIVSCNAENNVPVVGKEEVINRREMHWLRLDRYYKGDENNPEVYFQPMMCQHCDNAPCETVCPVLATAQSSDGLNQQVYNRCVGTRYCANNCPYKVRRFNWFDYPHNDKNEKMVLNPDVVVRSRGVMEKCSMCIQRIQEVKLDSKKKGQDVKDGDIKMACQQSCPGDAIVFGDLNDPKSKISRLLKHPRNYRLLEELNIQPRVNYLTKVKNRD